MNHPSRGGTLRRSLLLAAGTLVLLAGGCGPSTSEYFPLGNKRVWEYRITYTRGGEKQDQRVIIANMPQVNLEGTALFPRRRLDERMEYFMKADNAIFRIDSLNNRRTEVLPQQPKTGDTWNEPAKIQFLEMTGAFAGTFNQRIQNQLPMDYVVETMDDTVQVAAGRFRHCLRVRAKGSMIGGLTLRTYLRIRFIKAEQTDWYAPGVGLVKRLRNEYTTPGQFSTSYLEELVSVH